MYQERRREWRDGSIDSMPSNMGGGGGIPSNMGGRGGMFCISGDWKLMDVLGIDGNIEDIGLCGIP